MSVGQLDWPSPQPPLSLRVHTSPSPETLSTLFSLLPDVAHRAKEEPNAVGLTQGAGAMQVPALVSPLPCWAGKALSSVPFWGLPML